MSEWQADRRHTPIRQELDPIPKSTALMQPQHDRSRTRMPARLDTFQCCEGNTFFDSPFTHPKRITAINNFVHKDSCHAAFMPQQPHGL